MMQTSLLKQFLILFLSLLLAGCATTSGKGSSELDEEEAFRTTGLLPAAKLRFSDVPAPAGFKLLQDKSFVFQTDNTRVALLKYSGRAKLQDLVDFYKEQMLLSNWDLLNVVEYGKSVLNFERTGQSCIVSIDSKGMRKVITISVAPKARGSMETEKEK